jgi:hypothetical protein
VVSGSVDGADVSGAEVVAVSAVVAGAVVAGAAVVVVAATVVGCSVDDVDEAGSVGGGSDVSEPAPTGPLSAKTPSTAPTARTRFRPRLIPPSS